MHNLRLAPDAEPDPRSSEGAYALVERFKFLKDGQATQVAVGGPFPGALVIVPTPLRSLKPKKVSRFEFLESLPCGCWTWKHERCGAA